MRFLGKGVELPDAVACSPFSTPVRASMSRPPGLGPGQVLDGDLPYLEILFCFWQFGEVSRGVPERHELPAVGQDDRIFELAGPFRNANGASPSCPRRS